MSIDPTLLTKRAIADYLINTMLACRNLDAVKLWIRGGKPSPVQLNHDIFGEVIVASEGETDEQTGNAYADIPYTGLITLTIQLTEGGGDWIQPVGDRIATLKSYDQIEELVSSAVYELMKPAHKALGNLMVSGTIDGLAFSESVKRFHLTGPRLFGIDADERRNNYENFGSIPFQVFTRRHIL